VKVFLASLLSRKLWLAIAALIIFIVNKEYNQAMAIVLGYMGVNAVDNAVTPTQ